MLQIKLRCAKCDREIPSIQKMPNHQCQPQLDEQVAKANARDFDAAPSRQDRYATTTREELVAPHTRTCPVCGHPTKGSAACTYCGPDNNNFRPDRNLPPKREWIQQSGGLRVFKMTPDELKHYLETGTFPAYPTK